MILGTRATCNIYPPPCPEARSGVFIGCLTGPWDGDCGIVLGHPPPTHGISRTVSEFTAAPFFHVFFDIDLFTSQHPLWEQFLRLFIPKVPKTTEKRPKRVAIGPHFRSLWRYGWKCENDVFVYTKPSVSWFEGVPGTSCAGRFGHRNGDRRSDNLPDTQKR